MLYTKKTLNLLATFITLLTLGIAAMAAEPVFNTPTTAEASDIKPGSLLVWNLYTSSVSGANSDNTRISITNANSKREYRCICSLSKAPQEPWRMALSVSVRVTL
ncbi:MAG: hypothetical protein IPJ07_01245 [Acidobacteria bacterium]|nr:hypothetical protein [Acidobacteriota bacterium]